MRTTSAGTRARGPRRAPADGLRVLEAELRDDLLQEVDALARGVEHGHAGLALGDRDGQPGEARARSQVQHDLAEHGHVLRHAPRIEVVLRGHLARVDDRREVHLAVLFLQEARVQRVGVEDPLLDVRPLEGPREGRAEFVQARDGGIGLAGEVVDLGRRFRLGRRRLGAGGLHRASGKVPPRQRKVPPRQRKVPPRQRKVPPRQRRAAPRQRPVAPREPPEAPRGRSGSPTSLHRPRRPASPASRRDRDPWDLPLVGLSWASSGACTLGRPSKARRGSARVRDAYAPRAGCGLAGQEGFEPSTY